MKLEVGGIYSTPLPDHLPAVGFRFSLELSTSQGMITLHDSQCPRGKSRSVALRHRTIPCTETFSSVQLLSHVRLFVTPVDYSTPGFPVHHQLSEFTQTCVHWVGDAIQPSHPLLSPSPPSFILCQNQGLSNESALHISCQSLELQLQHQSFQWIFRTDFF